MKPFRIACTATALALAAALAVPTASAADKVQKKRQETERRMQDFASYLIDNQNAPDSAIPEELLRDCKGIMIFRQFKAGFGIGGQGGGGVALLRRADGSWSPPAFFQDAGASIGFQIGGQKVEAIFLIMNDDGVRMLLETRFTIGVNASAAAGPVGRDAAAKVGPGTAILSYSRAKGLFAGAKIEGGAMVNNDEANAALYGPGKGMKDILFDPNTPMPPEAMPLMNVLNRYAPPHVPAAEQPAATPAPQPTPPQEVPQKPLPPPELVPGPQPLRPVTPPPPAAPQQPPQPVQPPTPPVRVPITGPGGVMN